MGRDGAEPDRAPGPARGAAGGPGAEPGNQAEAVAIVGMACRYPGGVDSPAGLWQLAADGREAVGPLPADRGWDLAAVPGTEGPEPCAPGAPGVDRGGFLDGAAEFDAEFFGMTPAQAQAADPQHRLMLEVCWEACERAGLDPAELREAETGVFVAAASSGYGAGHPDGGAAEGPLSVRLADAFGLRDPAAGDPPAADPPHSLAALLQAGEALRAGECAFALAGGVTVHATPEEFLRPLGDLAPDGRCKAFAAAADGTGLAEGAAVLVLERLADARRGGHPVLALLRGGATRPQDGPGGPDAPDGASHLGLIRAALADAGLRPDEVDAVEAHGSGTAPGDTAEAAALIAAYGRDRAADRPLWLGAVTSNLGHTGRAAGAAGVIKTVEALQRGVLPKTLHAAAPTPRVDWHTGGVRLATKDVAWPRGERPRRAGVSSLGAATADTHVILEEAPPISTSPPVDPSPPVPAARPVSGPRPAPAGAVPAAGAAAASGASPSPASGRAVPSGPARTAAADSAAGAVPDTVPAAAPVAAPGSAGAGAEVSAPAGATGPVRGAVPGAAPTRGAAPGTVSASTPVPATRVGRAVVVEGIPGAGAGPVAGSGTGAASGAAPSVVPSAASGVGRAVTGGAPSAGSPGAVRDAAAPPGPVAAAAPMPGGATATASASSSPGAAPGAGRGAGSGPGTPAPSGAAVRRGRGGAAEETGAVLAWPVSGRSAAGLSAQARQLADFVSARPELDPRDLAWSLAATRPALEHRAAVVGTSREDLLAGLAALAEGRARTGTVSGVVGGAGRLGFVFTGQGAQRIGMGQGLHAAFPAFADAFDAACAALDSHLDRPLADVVRGGDAAGGAQPGTLDDTQWTQAALFAVEVALFRLLESWALRPDILAGHSIGELAAAHVAGVWSLPDAAAVVAARGRLMQALPRGGAMVAVATSERAAEAVLERHPGAALAAVNGPQAVVLSGEADAVTAAAAELAAAGARTHRLRVSHAFHSPLMEPMLAAFADVAASVSYRSPGIPMASALTGRAAADEVAEPGYWVRHVREPVRFADAAGVLRAAGVATFVEIGPDGVLATMGPQTRSGPGAPVGAGRPGEASDELWVPALRRGRDEPRTLVTTLARLHTRGVPVHWTAFHGSGGGRRVDLPTYPFQRRRYWLSAVTPAGGAPAPVRPDGDGRAEDRTAALLAALDRVEQGWAGLDPDRDTAERVAERLRRMLARWTAAVDGSAPDPGRPGADEDPAPRNTDARPDEGSGPA
ncbi:type I polyketide synthase [Actinacidiphila reveromycinica]|uniref:type I polyketide synthase n=1 Tax=Actinacidiphila reveromycinica TaxID=659352 RepID=UPI0019233B97|nr:type I polyketide synthase [Streptomyces sp. SN-593]